MSESAVSPDSTELADAAGLVRSAYVHVPFCARWCPYCDFAVVEGKDDLIGRYVDAVRREILSEVEWHALDAVFIGGGTPSRIDPGLIADILVALGERFGIGDGAEVSLEANPEDWNQERSDRLREAGVGRVSFGAQSFDPAVLGDLGRLHRPADIDRAIEAARVSGFDSLSLDLIFGTPGESLASWADSVDRAIATGVDHVSTYALTVEPPTALGRAVRAGAPSPDPDDQADKWELAAARLTEAGYIRYEVSNFAKPGHHCRYNLGVWAQGDYLAFGLGAHRFRDGLRSQNVRRLDTYIDRIEKGIGPIQAADPVEGWAAEQERLMLGLRRAAGVRPGPGGVALVESDAGRRLMEAGVLGLSEDRERLVVERPLLTDEVVRTVLALEPGRSSPGDGVGAS
jgi:putative oxygen-independent coproporphyrinogen III oxidase